MIILHNRRANSPIVSWRQQTADICVRAWANRTIYFLNSLKQIQRPARFKRYFLSYFLHHPAITSPIYIYIYLSNISGYNNNLYLMHINCQISVKDLYVRMFSEILYMQIKNIVWVHNVIMINYTQVINTELHRSMFCIGSFFFYFYPL